MRVSKFINEGQLVPDAVTIEIILEQVLSVPTDGGFLLDGFPRNLHQAESLETALSTRSRGLDKVIYINVPESELIVLLGGRFTCRQCQTPYTMPSGQKRDMKCQKCGGELYQRTDDAPEAIKTRIGVYQKETMPLLSFYRDRDLLVDIAGVGSIEAVNQRIKSALSLSQVPKARPKRVQ